MRVLMLGIVLAIAAVMPATTSADDEQIAEFIKARLIQEKERGNLFGFNVDMRVDRGTVWFKGFVSNRSQELMILRTAQLAGHLGVVQVVDDIEVNSPAGETTSQPPMQQTVQPQQTVRTAMPAQQSSQMQMQQHMQQQMQAQMQQQMQEMQQLKDQLKQEQVLREQMMQEQTMKEQMMREQMMREQMTREQMMRQKAQQPAANQPAQAMPPAAQAMPKRAMNEPQRVAMPLGAKTDSELNTTSVGYQEPVFTGTTDRTASAWSPPNAQAASPQDLNRMFNTSQPSVPAPAFQQNLLTPVQPQQQYARPQDSAPPAPIAHQPASTTTAMPVAAASGSPLPFARAAAPAQGCATGDCGGVITGGPVADSGFYGGMGGVGGMSSSANLPGYAWPSYAAHPNYGAVSYPKQYSPSAWPYIGPFYPYPQVPLGWRKVSLEWDDGWWYLDFHDKDKH